MAKSSKRMTVASEPHRFKRWITVARSSLAGYLARRPHRSFRLTRRRDYVRSLDLPGYWTFTAQVLSLIVKERQYFFGLVGFYGVLSVIFVGLASQAAYLQLSDLLDETGSEIFSGGWGAIGQASLVLLSSISGSLNPELTDVQQVYAVIIFLLTWLTTVWLLRARLANKKIRLRDGIYNAGAPIVGTSLVVAALLIQLLPATIGVLVMNSAIGAGLFDNGFIAMIISLVAGGLILLSLYWAVSSLIALVIVTLPGMYPWQAIRSAGDIVIGRRMRLLFRIIWLIVMNVVVWILVMLPVVLLTRAASGAVPFIGTLPIVPIIMTLVGSVLVVWSATYVYLLYRKVVEDDSLPA